MHRPDAPAICTGQMHRPDAPAICTGDLHRPDAPVGDHIATAAAPYNPSEYADPGPGTGLCNEINSRFPFNAT